MTQWPQMTYVFGAILLPICCWFGGWYWGLMYAPVLLQRLKSLREDLVLVGLPLGWLAGFAIKGDRRLFFPFALYLAAVFGQKWRGGFAVRHIDRVIHNDQDRAGGEF